MWDCIVTPWDVNGTDSFIRVICYCVFGTGNISCWPSVVWPSVSEYLRTSAVIVDVINQRVKSSRPCGPSGNITWCHHTHGSYVLSRLSSFFSMSSKCNYYQSRWFELKIVNFKDALELWHHCHNTTVVLRIHDSSAWTRFCERFYEIWGFFCCLKRHIPLTSPVIF